MHCSSRRLFVIILLVLTSSFISGNFVFAKTTMRAPLNCKSDMQCFAKAARTCTAARVTHNESDTSSGFSTSVDGRLEIRRITATRCEYRNTTERVRTNITAEGRSQFERAGRSSKEISQIQRQIDDSVKMLAGLVIQCQFSKIEDLSATIDALAQKQSIGGVQCGIDPATGTKKCEADGHLARATCVNAGPFVEYMDNIDLAKWKWGHDRNSEIVPHAARALKFAKNNEQKAIAHFWTGVGYFRIKKLKESRQHLQQAITLKADYGAPHVTLGAIALDENKLPAARKHAEKALQLDATYAWAHNLMGIVLSKEGKREEAMKEFQNAIAIDPKQETFKKNLDLEQLKK